MCCLATITRCGAPGRECALHRASEKVLAFSAGIVRRPYRTATTPTNDLRALRRNRGLSYVQLARRTGMPVRRLAEIEHGLGVPEPDQLRQIFQALRAEPQLLTNAT